jgi:hypothetical protein
MNNPFKQSEESSFEQGISVVKPVKAVSDAARQQAKAVTQDIVAQLYGVKSDGAQDSAVSDSTKQTSTSSSSASSSVIQQQISSQNPGIQSPEEIARYQALQNQLRGQGKSDEEIKAQSTHNQNYFRTTIGNVDDQMQKEAQKREKNEEERKKQIDEEAQQKKQAIAEQNQELPQATGKGRNRMGGKVKRKDVALNKAKTTTEINRGASG